MKSEEDRPKWRRIAVILLACAVVLAGIAGLAAVIWRDALRTWRAEQLAAAAENAFEAEEYEKARNRAAAAFQLSPTLPAALRMAARINAAGGHPQAAAFFESLMESGQATAHDHLEYAQWLMKQGDLEEAEQEAREAAKELEGDFDLLVIQAEIATMQGNLREALARLRQAQGLKSDDLRVRFALGMLLRQSPDEVEREEGMRIIREVADGPTSQQEEAATLWIAQDVEWPIEERKVVVEKLVREAEKNPSLATAAAVARMGLEPSKRQEILQELEMAARRFPVEQKRDVAAWFVQQEEYALARMLINRNAALARKDFFLVWLDATAGEGDWEEIKEVLKQSRVPLEKEYLALYLGRAEQMLGNESVARRYYEQALAESARDVTALWYLAGYFDRIGEGGLAVSALEKLTENPTLARPAFEAMIPILEQRRDTRGLVRVLEKMHERWPDDAAVANDLLYLRLLQGLGGRASLEEARERMKENPEVFPFRVTYSLALLREGRAEDALELFEGSEVQLGELLPWQQAVFARILAECGMKDAARLVADGIPRDQLRPEEEELLRGIGETATSSSSF